MIKTLKPFPFLDQGLGKFFEKMVLFFFSLVFLLSLYALCSDRFLLRFIPEFKQSLIPIAKVSFKKGMVIRKTRLDSLWIPVELGAVLYDGDRFMTYDDSAAEIIISEKAKIYVEPSSIVRVRNVDGKPLIRVSNGSVKTEFTEDQTILIKKGSKIEEVVVRKGEYFIRNESSAGIQITTYNSQFKSVGGKTEPEKQTKMKVAEEKTADTESISDEDKLKETENSPKLSIEEIKKAEAVAQAIEDANYLYDLPTPKAHTLFLLKAERKNPQKLLISAEQKCNNKCKLTLYRDQEILKHAEFISPQQPLFWLEPQEIKPGNYKWVYESETAQSESDFKVQDFSNDIIKGFINASEENDGPIEILY